jgi:hypothetical protein
VVAARWGDEGPIIGAAFPADAAVGEIEAKKVVDTHGGANPRDFQAGDQPV